ncbi:MAG: 2-succinylbenzoate--CoA ligase [Myxococcota bacterium]|nr:2-succinylbenzoate--CoA ligase [Myxococcota bacterium]
MICPLYQAAQKHPDAIAFIDGETRYTYTQWNEAAQGVSLFLENTVKKEAHIALHTLSPFETGAWIFGIARFGGSAVLLTGRDPNEVIPARMKATNADTCFSHLPPSAAVTSPPSVDRDRIFALLFTSGSTQTPKAVAHSLRGHLASARMSNENIALLPRDRWLLSLSLWHIGGLAILFRCLLAGATMVIRSSNSLARDVLRYDITHLSLVSTQLYRMLSEHDSAIPSLKAVLVGGGPIPSTLIERAGHLPLHTTYGMTELGSQLCTTPPNASREMLRSAGRPLHGWEICISSAGEIWARGAPLFMGYWKEDILHKPFDEHGWFHTRDTGKIDDQGLLYPIGRMDQMFISGGENIHPEEIEHVLMSDPKIEMALVIPVPHEQYGQRPIAFLKGDYEEETLRQRLAVALPKFKIPDRFFDWPKSLSTHKPSRALAKRLLLPMIF